MSPQDLDKVEIKDTKKFLTTTNKHTNAEQLNSGILVVRVSTSEQHPEIQIV